MLFRSAEDLMPFIDAVLAGNWSEVEQRYADISELEERADKLKREIRMNLPRSLFLAFSRNNLLDVLQVQDRIANRTKDVAGLILGRRMTFPVAMHDMLKNYVHASTDAVRLAREAMDELNDLISTGFSGQEIEFVQKILERLHKAESKSDECQIEIRRIVFEHESEMNPVDVMFIYDIIRLTGKIADDAQTVGNRMMYLIAS